MKKFFFLNQEFSVFPTVYEPAEDSFLLAESVEVGENSSVLDLGCGTGIQGINSLLKGAGKVVFSDLNPGAVENAKENVGKISSLEKAEFKESDLFAEISGKFDTIIFNPPYVHSERKELMDVDGGNQGREILDRFLGQFPEYLNRNGRCFFLQSDLNGIGETERKLKKRGLNFEIIAKKKLFFEKLLVFSCCKG
ncbi:MAG: HemK2/MTQ2 family protein methyltransferase [Candidatus Diapherotrites archaeon]